MSKKFANSPYEKKMTPLLLEKKLCRSSPPFTLPNPSLSAFQVPPKNNSSFLKTQMQK